MVVGLAVADGWKLSEGRNTRRAGKAPGQRARAEGRGQSAQ